MNISPTLISKPNVKFSSSPPPEIQEVGKEPQFSVSFFQGKNDAVPKPGKARTWEEFVESFRRPTIRANKDGPLFSPARFIRPRRLNENVHSICMLVMDFDGLIALIEALEVCEEMGFNYLIYTTHSHRRITDKHSESEDHFRIVLPLLTPIPAGDFHLLFDWANCIFGYKADTSRRDLAGMFYLPAVYDQDSPYEFYAKTDGAFLDWRGVIEVDGFAPSGLTQTPFGQTNAVDDVCDVFPLPPPSVGNGEDTTNSTSSAFVAPQASVPSSPGLPLSIEDITHNPDDPFQVWKAGLIAHLSKHPKARMISKKVNVPGLCHGSQEGSAVFGDPRLCRIECTDKETKCSITTVAKGYNYPPPPKEGNQFKTRPLSTFTKNRPRGWPKIPHYFLVRPLPNTKDSTPRPP